MPEIALSALDQSPIRSGGTPAQAVRETVELARHCDALGYTRYWIAEHHNSGGLASASPEILIAHVAAATSGIRVGSGGVMLTHYSALKVAEQFRMLEALHPGRIDLGLGRAPGTDGMTARALRRHITHEDDFPRDVVELIGYLDDPDAAAHVRAVPGAGTHVPVWILGSSIYGAQLAAYLGLPYAFASHFAPAMLQDAFAIYRETFRPSRWLARPYAMMAVGVCAAETDAEARYLRTSQQLAFARLRSGRPGKLPRPVEDISAEVQGPVLAQVEQALSCSATGSRETVARRLAELVERHRPDELMVTGMIHDHGARVRSFAIAAEVLTELRATRAAA